MKYHIVHNIVCEKRPRETAGVKAIKPFAADDYDGVKDWIFNLKLFGDVKLRLTVMEQLLARMGSPHKRLRVVHVGGTNGKGSTVAMISSMLEAAGYKVGMFTKPHLTNFTERISVNGVQISEAKVIAMINGMLPAVEAVAASHQHPTFFELTAALMLKYFADEKVDFAVVEVGMGGRLDATNVVDALVCVITNISFEHTAVLGDTIEKIAAEKAGIIKEGGVLATTSDDERALGVFRDVCAAKHARMFVAGKDIVFEKTKSGMDGQTFDVRASYGRSFEALHTPLLGEYQITNAAAAIGAIEALKLRGIEIPESAIREGLAKVKWPGRLEIMQTKPYVVIDGAKDVLATQTLAAEVPKIFSYDKLVLVVSISRDKRIGEMMRDLLAIADYVVATRHKVKGRAVEPEQLAAFARNAGKDAIVVYDSKDAVKQAMELAGADGLVLVTGSIFVVGEARELWYPAVDFRWGREFNES
jgi:dihydrofolate synthase/folylpolyglutamate synthase